MKFCKGKGQAFDHCSYRGHKLTDSLMKMLEQALDFYIHEMVNIDEI